MFVDLNSVNFKSCGLDIEKNLFDRYYYEQYDIDDEDIYVESDKFEMSQMMYEILEMCEDDYSAMFVICNDGDIIVGCKFYDEIQIVKLKANKKGKLTREDLNLLFWMDVEFNFDSYGVFVELEDGKYYIIFE